MVFLFKNIIEILKSYNNSFIIITIILIIIFEFLVDMPEFKKAKEKNDARVTIAMNITLFVLVIALFIIMKI